MNVLMSSFSNNIFVAYSESITDWSVENLFYISSYYLLGVILLFFIILIMQCLNIIIIILDL